MNTASQYPIPVASRLFDGITREQANELLTKLGTTVMKVSKGDVIIRQWSMPHHHYAVVSGEVHTFYTHPDGKRTITGYFRSGDTFGLLFAFNKIKGHPSEAVAVTDSVILKMRISDIVTDDTLISSHVGRRFLQNAVNSMSEEAFLARLRAFVVSRPTVRERVLTFLNEKSKHFNSSEFEIPFDRQELADYLDCDRSSLCMALSKLKDERIIDYSRNKFWIRVPFE